MDANRIKILLQKYKAGEATTEEQLLLENWYARESMRQMQNPEMEDYVHIKNEMWVNMEQQLPVKKRAIKLWPRITIAAAAVAAIVFGVFFFKAPRHPEGSAATRELTNDIAPGKNTATLTLANGKTIILSDVKTGVIVGVNKLSYNDGSVINDPSLAKAISPQGGERMETLTAATPRGGTYQITLPDGSRAWLNADTKISFPSQFIGKQRKILIINGEVYFEVAKNKEKPFIVESDGQLVTVLGTHFNISAYKDESSTKTTLLEGSVKVSSSRQSEVTLKPSQQATVTGSSDITVKQVDAEEAISWKEGYFGFSNETLESVMKKVSRWYDVQVVFADEKVKQKIILGSVSRYENLSKVIRVLERLEVAEFKIEGKTITIDKKK